MSERCFYQTNISIKDILCSDYKFPTGKNFNCFGTSITNIISEQWLNYARSLGLIFKGPMIFFRDKNINFQTAHIDLHFTKHIPIPGAFNFVIGGNDSDMVWYKLPSGNLNIKFTMYNSPYVEWNKNELEEIDRYSIKEGEIVLVRTDAPHAIEMKEDPRWCVSLRLENNENFTWTSLVQLAKDKNLLL